MAKSNNLITYSEVAIGMDLAEMYGVEVKRLNEAARRNISRSPEDFMFQLIEAEWQNLKLQLASSSWVVSVRCLCIYRAGYTQRKQVLPDNKYLWKRIEK